VIKRTGKPVLGICCGIQVINFALGGTLIQDLPTYKAKFGHNQKAKGTVLTHSVEVIKDTLLYDIVKKNSFTVNSFHHQACKKLGNGLIANALALDGIIEAASLANHRFFLVCSGIRSIFTGLMRMQQKFGMRLLARAENNARLFRM